MRPSPSLLVVLPAPLATACSSRGPSMQTAIDSVQGRIDALMQDYAGARPGAAVLVVRDGRPVVRSGYGLADTGRGTPVTPRTSFRLASISKQFTAAAILLLYQDGRLSLDDRARHWLPSLPQAFDAVTLHQLLTHTSGVPDYEDLVDPADTRQLRDADVLRLLAAAARLDVSPGSRYRYSNSGYALLALVVAAASGRDYAGVLRERIFVPLGMDSVAFEQGISTVPQRAYGHGRDGTGWARTDQSTTSAVLGDGGIYASIDDLARWDAALHDDRLLAADARALAFRPHVATDEPGVAGYGYGWRIDGDLLWHSGETIGFRNVILRWPRARLTVVVLTNRDAPGPCALARRIADAARGAVPAP